MSTIGIGRNHRPVNHLAPESKENKMLSPATYTCGWLDSSLNDFLSDEESLPSGMHYALVTCLDSSFDTATALFNSESLRPLRRHARKVGPAFAVRTEHLINCHEQRRIFCGYDEVFFFASLPAEKKPGGLTLVGPQRVDGNMETKLTRWMDRVGCKLALGDGDGLNFIIRASGIARKLLAHSVPNVAASA